MKTRQMLWQIITTGLSMCSLMIPLADYLPIPSGHGEDFPGQNFPLGVELADIGQPCTIGWI